jgi:hypothetical protein
MRKKYFWFSVICLIAMFFSACSAKNLASGGTADTSLPEAGWSSDTVTQGTTQENGETPQQDYGGHKVIKTAVMEIETKNFDGDLEHIQQKAEEMGGYVASMSVSGTKPENYGDGGRRAELTLRVPQNDLDSFMEDTRGLSDVIYENLDTEDITNSYMDTQSRLKIYQTQYDRLLELLEKAEKMEDIITLENELTRVTYEIESLTSSLEQWDDLVDFSTVTVTLYERSVFSSVTGSGESMGSRMKEGLLNSLNDIARFFENFLVGFVSALPVLVLLAVIGLAVFLIVKGILRKRKKRKISPEQNQQNT